MESTRDDKPEHLKSDAVKHPAAYPEDKKFSIHKETWDALAKKYGEEKVKMYYRLIEDPKEFIAAIAITAPNPEMK